jgi:uncharacterized membrane protein
LLLLISALLVVTHPDQDSTSMTAALRPLAFGALSVAMMLTMAVSLSRSTRQIAVEGMAAAAEQRFRRLNVFVLLLAGYGTAMMLSAVALESMPALGVHLAGSLGFLMVPLMAINFGIAFWMFRVGQGGQRAIAGTEPQDARGDRTPDDAWRVGGLFYYNPSDPAVWVEKRVGLGYTLNMGNSRAWLLVAMLLLPMLAGPLLFR